MSEDTSVAKSYEAEAVQQEDKKIKREKSVAIVM